MAAQTKPVVDSVEQIRMQVHQIEARASEIEILLKTIVEKIDSAASSSAIDALEAIDCYTTCAMRSAALVREHGEHIMALTSEKGGA